METVYTLHVDITSVPIEVIEEQELRMGYLVLTTNHKDVAELPAEQVLREYKQQSSVELSFKFLKDPILANNKSEKDTLLRAQMDWAVKVNYVGCTLY